MRSAGTAGGCSPASPSAVLVSPCLSAPRTIRLLPPMVLADADLDLAMVALDAALDAARPLADPADGGRTGVLS
jgi:4-aminobutyrate aminotransferase-like enzyme